MELAALFDHYNDAFMARYKNQLLPVQEQAMNAIRRCRTPAAGEMRIHCSECDRTHAQPLSCGNRNCPKCQNHETTKWLDRQRKKLLPVDYFMVTFTLPAEYRDLTWRHQRIAQFYSARFTGPYRIEGAAPTTADSLRGLPIRAVHGDANSTCVAIWIAFKVLNESRITHRGDEKQTMISLLF